MNLPNLEKKTYQWKETIMEEKQGFHERTMSVSSIQDTLPILLPTLYLIVQLSHVHNYLLILACKELDSIIVFTWGLPGH